MGPNIFGGPRTAKGFERKQRRSGVLGADEFVVQGAGAPVDRYGNVPGAFIVRVLSQLQASDERGFLAIQTPTSLARRRRGKKRQVAFFIGGRGRAGHLPRGIYARTEFAFGSAIKPVFLFVDQPRYRKKFPFFEIGNRVAARVLPAEFDKALARALATAR